MNILYLCHRIPYPPDKGDKIRSFHQIEQLAREHTVHLACLIDDPNDLQHVKTLEKYCASVDAVYQGRGAARLRALAALFTGAPLSVAAFASRALRKKIQARMRSETFDRIIMFSSAMAQYINPGSGIPAVMDFVDLDSEKWRLYADVHPFPMSWVYRLEARRLARYEEQVARIFDHAIFVSEKEAELFRSRVTDQPVSVIPNGVDTDYYDPVLLAREDSGPPTLVFVGAMDYFPNVDAVQYFCERIFPLIRVEIPTAILYIVGRNPARPVRKLGRHPNVIVTGAVPDVRPYLAQAHLAVAPFRVARGIQNKVLEAMAMGVPVVGTSMAFQGMPVNPLNGIWICDDPDGFGEQVVRLLMDAQLRNRCSVAARSYVERYHRWLDHGTRLDMLLQRIG